MGEPVPHHRLNHPVVYLGIDVSAVVDNVAWGKNEKRKERKQRGIFTAYADDWLAWRGLLLLFCISTCNFAIGFRRRLPVDYDCAWTTLFADHSHVFRGRTGRWSKNIVIDYSESRVSEKIFKRCSMGCRDLTLMESFTQITQVVNGWKAHVPDWLTGF